MHFNVFTVTAYGVTLSGCLRLIMNASIMSRSCQRRRTAAFIVTGISLKPKAKGEKQNSLAAADCHSPRRDGNSGELLLICSQFFSILQFSVVCGGQGEGIPGNGKINPLCIAIPFLSSRADINLLASASCPLRCQQMRVFLQIM